MRPGRIDRKVQYKLATKGQASALFTRFYAELYKVTQTTSAATEKDTIPLATLAENFAEGVPDHEFSTAELQGFLLSCKKSPDEAVARVSSWTEQELMERQQKVTREARRKDALREKKERLEVRQLGGTMARLGGMGMSMYPPMTTAGMVIGNPVIPSPNPPSPSPAYEDASGKAELQLTSVDLTSVPEIIPEPAAVHLEEKLINSMSTMPS